MIDLQAVSNAHENHEISNIWYIKGPNNPADGLTKSAKSYPLNYLLETGKCDRTVEQLVLRNNNAPKKY